VLHTSGSLLVVIRGEAHPVAVTARYMARNGALPESKTGFTGTGFVLLNDIRPGTWLVSLVSGERETQGVAVEVSPGEMTRVEIDP